jgi:glycosyltransferase involved in cell wall biosynthesis
MTRSKVLAIAYACNPIKGSESGVGWGWVNAIATNHDITVITADYNTGDINQYLEGREGRRGNNPRFLYVKNRPWHYRPRGVWLKIEDSLAKPLMNLAYHDWLRYAFEEAKREIAQNHYDLVHLITYVGWRFPGNFYRLGIPFVWGPIGGMKNTPWRLLPILGLRGALYYGGRNLINSLQLRTLQGPKRALRAADRGVIAATSEIREELWTRFRVKSHVICEVGPPQPEAESPTQRGENETFRICWSGTHLPGKALHLLLRAAARLPKDLDYSIEILGDGPSNQDWRAMASRLNIDDRCHWHGWLPRSQSLAVMRTSHVFVITSLKDLTSNVAVEAVSLGLPVVCLDHCGFADLVTEECGIKVYPVSAHQIISDLSEALRTLYRDETLRRTLAQGASQRSRDYLWSNKMAALDRVYADVKSPQEKE